MAVELKQLHTKINGRDAVVVVVKRAEGYIVNFINTEFSDFINSYETGGFKVKIKDGVSEFILSGKFPLDEAMNVWGNIEHRLEGNWIKAVPSSEE